MKNEIIRLHKRVMAASEEWGGIKSPSDLAGEVKKLLGFQYTGNRVMAEKAAALTQAAIEFDLSCKIDIYGVQHAALERARREVRELRRVEGNISLDTNPSGEWIARWADGYSHAGNGIAFGVSPSAAAAALREEASADARSIMRD